MNGETCRLLNSELEGYEISFKCLIVYGLLLFHKESIMHLHSLRTQRG